MELKRLFKGEDFQKLKKGDMIIVEWDKTGTGKRGKKIIMYQIYEVKHSLHEIICRYNGNHYFNYRMFMERRSCANDVWEVKEG